MVNWSPCFEPMWNIMAESKPPIAWLVPEREKEEGWGPTVPFEDTPTVT
jgi:hypothetical protein